MKAAEARGGVQLAGPIHLAMYSGARIEELCALKVDAVAADHFSVVDAKSGAGVRQVPLHSALKTTMRRLLRASKDGYVLSGLTPNKYGDRSGAMGTGFGRLKRALGYGKQHVFHSIRKTVATLLEDAGVPEGVAEGIIVRDKPTMTYGLYSGGASMKTEREAIEKISYPSRS
jgi:integrase